MKKLLFTVLALSSFAALASETDLSSNGCRDGFSNANLSKVTESARFLEVRVAGRYTLHFRISKKRNPLHLSAANSIHIEGDSVDFEPLEAISKIIESNQVEAVCVRPNPSSYYRDTVLQPEFEMDYGIVRGNSYQIDVLQPFPQK